MFLLSSSVCRNAAPVVRRRTIMITVAANLFAVSLLASAISCRAEQGPPRKPGDTIPTLEALRSTTLPRGRFVKWCGDGIVMEVDRRCEVYDGEVKASPVSFPLRPNLLCGGNNPAIREFHPGIDAVVPAGTEIQSVSGGRIIYSGYMARIG